MGNQNLEGSWIYCDRCHGKLLKRLPNGILHFVFGKSRNSDGSLSKRSPIDMQIYGSLKIQCFRWECRHTNIVNFFPPVILPNEK